jgi:hypothetical protein
MTVIRCENCECWIDPENNPVGEYADYGYCSLLSGSLDWGAAQEKYGESKAITTCDKESIYGELQTKADFGCILFRSVPNAKGNVPADTRAAK